MLCEKCGKNEATFYYRENINGTEKAYHLCGECAKALEVSGEIASMDDRFLDSIHQIFTGDNLFGSLFAPVSTKRLPMAQEKKTCPLCGATFDDIAKSGKLGCPKCYEVFGDALPLTVQRIHGRTRHTGSAPKRFRAAIEQKERIHALEKELHEAVHNEEYEKAATLRDTLRSLRASDSAVDTANNGQ